jgi:uncharacterized protein (TIGR02246 family)
MRSKRLVSSAGTLILFLSPFAVSVAAQAASAGPQGPAKDASAAAAEADLRGLITRMTDSYNRGDAHGVAAMYTPDGDLITGTGDHLAGPAEIESFLSNLVMTLPKGTRFIARVTDIRFAGPDVALVTSDGGWLYPGEANVSEKNQGLQSVVALRRDGTWRVVLFQRTRITPQPAAKQ